MFHSYRHVGLAAFAAALSLAESRSLSAQTDYYDTDRGRPDAGGAPVMSSDSIDVIAVVTRYQKALETGDSSTALSMLAGDAIVIESGGVESRQEYRSHHLPADMSFARAVPSTRADLRAVVRGDVAWVSSTSTARGEFRGRQVNSSGAELMVLSREADGWKIRAIHWSSRSRNR